MEEAGFTEITIEVVQKESSYNNEDDFIKGFIDGSPLSSFLINKDDKVKTELKDKVKKAMQEQAKDYGKSVPLQALVCSGEKR